MRVKVLLIEDDLAFAVDLGRALIALDCDVTTLADGNAGLARATSDRFDVILASVEIAGMNGFRLCNRLKKHPTARGVPIILFFGDASASAVESHEALPTHADRYVKKPFLPADVLGQVRALVPALSRSGPASKSLRPRRPALPLPSDVRGQKGPDEKTAARLDELKKRVSDLEAEKARLDRELKRRDADLAAERSRGADLVRERDDLAIKTTRHAEQVAEMRKVFEEVIAAASEERAVLTGKIAALTAELAKRRPPPPKG